MTCRVCSCFKACQRGGRTPYYESNGAYAVDVDIHCKNFHLNLDAINAINDGVEENATDGVKHDGGKMRCDLVPPEIIEAVGAVRTYGVQKYGKEYSYREVEPKRYRAALMRHICAWLKNPFGKDEESGLPHIWHVACNVAFLIELDKEKDNG